MEENRILKRLDELNIVLPAALPPNGIYSVAREFGDNKLMYSSGVGPDRPNKPYFGKVGQEYTMEEGQYAAYDCVLNLLARLQQQLGSLDRIKRFVKILGFVASTTDFYQQTAVLNGASQIILDVFGKDVGLPARSAIGVAVLPRNIPVEIEVLLEIC